MHQSIPEMIDQNLSLYIPRIYPNVSLQQIKRAIEGLQFGQVQRIDCKPLREKRGINSFSVYIYFDYWIDSVAVAHFQERVKNPEKEARIVYKDPWYWTILENKSEQNSLTEGEFDKLDDAYAEYYDALHSKQIETIADLERKLASEKETVEKQARIIKYLFEMINHHKPQEDLKKYNIYSFPISEKEWEQII
jgi:hypothetical protein